MAAATRMLALALGAVAALAFTPSTAHAIIQTDVVVVVGVELAPADGRAAEARERDLARHGLRVFVTPSLYGGDVKPTFRYVLGRAVGTLPLDRPDAPLVLPLPDAALTAEVARALAATGHPGEPRLVVVVQRHGGK